MLEYEGGVVSVDRNMLEAAWELIKYLSLSIGIKAHKAVHKLTHYVAMRLHYSSTLYSTFGVCKERFSIFIDY